jgi:quercetin dioxygenase-like cupin family protein
MEVVRPTEVTPTDAGGTFFTGRATLQPLVTAQMSQECTLTVVNFDLGVRNTWHRHSRDQVLLITDGAGIVATEADEVEVHPGDVILIPAGEKHWHGATPHSVLSHIALNGPGSQIEAAD